MISPPAEQTVAKVIQMPKARSEAPLWATLASTFFYVGRAKPGPGTWAAAIAMLAWMGIGSILGSAWQTPTLICAAVAVTALGVVAGTRYSRATAKKDPCEVVLDEVAGQLIALMAVPIAWKSMLAGLILFRVFDIAKPFPLRRLERFPEGFGIMADDVGAGLYALAVMQVLLHYGLLT